MKISVVIPSFNAEPFIATAIESCLNQNLRPHEVIVVDDASSDRTVEIAKSYPAPVRVIRCEQNGGVSVARNRGAEEATGDWIALLDADDWFLPGRFEAQIRCVEQNPEAKVIYSGFRMRELDGRERDSVAFPLEKLRNMMRYRCAFHISTVIMKRDAFHAIDGFDTSLRRSEDYDFWLRLAAQFSMNAFASVPEILSVYRLTPGSKSLNTLPFRAARYAAIESSGLYGLSGIQRVLWRRKVRAFTDYDISIRLREDGSPRDLEFIFRSLLLWPFPSEAIPLRRYLIAAVMLKQHIEKYLRN
ncbi:MAG: glycosyltransferase [Terracidiphilus sp.]